jgi:hypothetical protein
VSIQTRQLLESVKGRFGDYAARVTVFTDVKMFATFSDCIQSCTLACAHTYPNLKNWTHCQWLKNLKAKVVNSRKARCTCFQHSIKVTRSYKILPPVPRKLPWSQFLREVIRKCKTLTHWFQRVGSSFLCIILSNFVNLLEGKGGQRKHFSTTEECEGRRERNNWLVWNTNPCSVWLQVLSQ